MTRATFLIQSEFDRLEDWCAKVRTIFGPVYGPYLVGSATERADYRDVDIRVLMPDGVFDVWFRGRLEAVRFTNRCYSIWGQQETGLPIDFQVQRMTEANAEFTKPRNPMGVRDWSIIPTSGVPEHPERVALSPESLGAALSGEVRGTQAREGEPMNDKTTYTTAGLSAKVELRKAWFAAHPDTPADIAREQVDGLFASIEREAVATEEQRRIEQAFIDGSVEGSPIDHDGNPRSESSDD